MWTNNRTANEPSTIARQPTASICCALACLLGVVAVPASAQVTSVNTVTVDAGTVLRELPARHLLGHNLNFQESAFDSFDPDLGGLHPAAYEALKETRPGLLRFPAGNQSYGYHFELARQGSAGRVLR